MAPVKMTAFMLGPALPSFSSTRRGSIRMTSPTQPPADEEATISKDDNNDSASTSVTPELETPVADVCAGCGRAGGATSGCDGDGRIQGGLGAVLTWWPIKAYRPCPDFLAAKKTYRRAGQSLEEIAFGRKGQGDDLSIGERLGGGK